MLVVCFLPPSLNSDVKCVTSIFAHVVSFLENEARGACHHNHFFSLLSWNVSFLFQWHELIRIGKEIVVLGFNATLCDFSSVCSLHVWQMLWVFDFWFSILQSCKCLKLLGFNWATHFSMFLRPKEVRCLTSLLNWCFNSPTWRLNSLGPSENSILGINQICLKRESLPGNYSKLLLFGTIAACPIKLLSKIEYTLFPLTKYKWRTL